MPNEEEIDFDKAKPIKLAHEADVEKMVGFFSKEEPNKLQPKEITEELLQRLYENMEEAKHLATLIDMDKNDLKELGRGLENVAKGKYVAMFKTVKGRKSVDWEAYAKSQIKNIPGEELAPYTKESEPSVRLEIRKLD
jgi:hypothetical protein